jgi:uncharacterized phage protein gp47/JayE
MTIQNGTFNEETTEAILDAMIADAKDYWEDDLNDTSLNVIRNFYRPIAMRLADAQLDIGLVLESTQIDYAEGQALDLLCALIGVKRDKADRADGYVTFSRDTPAKSNYTAPTGTVVQTDSASPTKFETTDTAILREYDDFEDADISEYEGDTSSFSVQSSTVLEDSYSLEGPATSGVEIHRTNVELNEGSDFQFLTQVGTNATSITRFSYIDANNYYQVVVDDNNDRVALELVEGGTKSTVVEDTSAGVPNGERLKAKVKWDRGGDFDLYFLDSADNQFASLSGSDPTHTGGGIGFKSGDANAKKYWDFMTATAATAPVKAVEPGVEGNTARDTIIVMPDPPTGIEHVTNKHETNGGSAKEDDEELRQRAKEELAEGSRASAPALINSVKAIDGVTSVNIFIIENDSDDDDDGFELIVEGGDTEDIADAILHTMAAGDTSWGGVNGTKDSASADLPNGQALTIEFSRPNSIKISVDADLTITDEFEGKDAVRDSIVDYIGGLFSSGNDSHGLGSGENVIFGEVEFAIREVAGVHDIANLTVDTSSTSGNTSNISISDNEVATSDATDGSMTFSTTQK